MSSTFSNWKSDNYKFVGKAFDFAYADRLNKLSPVVGEVNANSIDYELTGSGGYGEAPRYDGENLNEGSLHRGFKTVITPVEYTLSIPVAYKEAMPAGFQRAYRIWRDGVTVTSRYRWRGGKLLIPERDAGSEFIVEYFAEPEDIPADADDSYEFELAADACECMPYYVAAQQLLPDLVMDYGAMLTMYDRAVERLDTAVPGENDRIGQSFFRG